MKDRIHQIMESKGMTQKTFASELNIAEATISGIFNGRTRPTNQTVQAIHDRFPEVNISWLMFGEGEMYAASKTAYEETSSNEQGSSFSKNNINNESDDLFGQFEFDSNQLQQPQSTPQSSSNTQVQQQVKIIEKYIDKPTRKITEIRVYFDDNTFESFSPIA